MNSVKLWNHQQKILDFIEDKPYALINAGMASGKTLISLLKIKDLGKGLIICPKPVIGAWLDDNEKFNLGLNLIPLNKGSVKDKNKQLLEGNEVYIANYESARSFDIQDSNLNFVVCDEIHRLKSYNSKQSIEIALKSKDIPFKLGLTGTPWTEGCEAIYGITRFFELLPFPRGYPRNNLFGSYQDFLNKYCITYLLNNIPIIKGYKNIEELMNIISPFTISIRTEDVVELPKIIERTYRPSLKGEVLKAYKSLERDSIIELEDDKDIVAPHILTQVVRLHQLSTSGELEGVIFEGLEERKELIKELVEETVEPIVIFTRFKRDIDLLKEWIKEPISILSGEIDSHREFLEGKTRILLANIASGSEGIRLERARHIIFYSTSYSALQFKQAIRRIQRPDSEYKSVNIIHILTKDTIEEKIKAIIDRKLNTEEIGDRYLTWIQN